MNLHSVMAQSISRYYGCILECMPTNLLLLPNNNGLLRLNSRLFPKTSFYLMQR